MNRVAIVTGASRGIGRAIALRLAAEGDRVVLAARDEAALAAAADEIAAAGGTAAVHVADLRRPEAAPALVAAALDAFGGLDVLVSNAGATKRGDFLELTDADWADGFALKLFGAARLAREAWPQLRARQGSIVFIAGVGGRTPGAEFAIGGAVNAGLLSLTKALAERGVAEGVQVNAVNPGMVRTDRLTARLAALVRTAGLDLAGAEARMAAQAGVTRIGAPEDIAGLVAFIVSPAGRQLHGALIDMDGGQTKTI